MIKDDILKFRAKNNLSQAKMAALAGVSLQTIANIENGIQTPSKLTEQKIKLVFEDFEKGDK